MARVNLDSESGLLDALPDEYRSCARALTKYCLMFQSLFCSFLRGLFPCLPAVMPMVPGRVDARHDEK